MIRLLALSLILISSSSFAFDSRGQWEEYGEGGSEELLSSDEEYRWLFEALFPEALRLAYPNESFKSFRVHLRDTFEKFPAPDTLKKVNLDKASEISGRITYAALFPKEYRYSVTYGEKGEVIIGVRIHLKGLRQGEGADFAAKIKEAQGIWNQGRAAMDFAYGFRFDLVEREEDAQFSVQVLDSTRGPYDQYWSRKWTGRAIAHEIGHMMGLGDEYKTLKGTIDCLVESLMCEGWAGDPMSHHYYFILRRLMIPTNAPVWE